MSYKPCARFRAFPDIAIPDVARAFGFVDESYSGDRCAQSVLKLPYGCGETFQLWVDHEISVLRQRNDRRFTLCWAQSVEQANLGLADVIYASDSEHEIAAAILGSLIILNNVRHAHTPWHKFGWGLWFAEKMRRCYRLGFDPARREYFATAIRILNDAGGTFHAVNQQAH